MSISASIDFLLLDDINYKFSIIEFVNEMLKNNWKIVKNNKISYLPL